MKFISLLESFAMMAVVFCAILRTGPLCYGQTEPVKSGLDARALAERLAKAVQYQTVSYEDKTGLQKEQFLGFQHFLEASFPEFHKATTREVIGDYSLLYTWKGKDNRKQPILLAAHTDVVPAENEPGSAWTNPPFEGRIADGFIWGRGTLDDKMTVMGILEAAEKMIGENYAPDQTIYIAFGHDEEIGGRHGAAKIAALLESRGVKLDYVLDEGLTITEGMVANISKPVALIGIAEKGCLSVELSVQSGGGHSMMPPRETAIGILSTAIARIEKKQFPKRLEVPVRKMFESLAPEMPFGMRMVFSNLWLFEGIVKQTLAAAPRTNALVRTTTAPTIFHAGIKENVLATQARAVVNFRLLPGDSIDQVLRTIRDVVHDSRVNIAVVERLKSEPSSIADTESAGYKSVEQAIYKVFPDVIVVPGLVIAATDSRHYSALTTNILHFSPIRLQSDDLRRIHGKDERISMEDYENVVRFYIQLLGSGRVLP